MLVVVLLIITIIIMVLIIVITIIIMVLVFIIIASLAGLKKIRLKKWKSNHMSMEGRLKKLTPAVIVAALTSVVRVV